MCYKRLPMGLWNPPAENAPSNRSSAPFLLMIGASMISLSGVYVKLAHVSPIVAGVYRTFFGGLLLLAIAVWQRQRLWKSTRYFLLQSACGLIFALDLIFWHRSIHYVGPGLATLLANFQVFFLAFFGTWALGERAGIRLVVAIFLAMAGLTLIVGIQWDQLPKLYRLGVIYGMGAALCYAGYILTLRTLGSLDRPLSPVANLTVISTISTAFLASEAGRLGQSFEIPALQSGVALLGYAIFSQVLGWILITKAVPVIRVSLAGLLLLLQPSLAFVWDVLFFDLKVTGSNIAGAALALMAIYLGSTRRSGPEK